MVRRWRFAAEFLALLALLANAALLPALHFAAGGPGSAFLAEVSHHPGHDGGAGPHDGGNDPAADGHQVCHFCRLLGVALPPPSTVLVSIYTFETVHWPADDRSVTRPQTLRVANLPRAPPVRG
jgi:hypothetical protein